MLTLLLLQVPLIGFCGAPWTLMAYMIEGGGSKTFARAKTWLYADPRSSHRLLSLIADVSAGYLVCQVKAGAQMLQLFESWAGELSPDLFNQFSLPYLRRIVRTVRLSLDDLGIPRVPVVVFAKGAHYAVEALGNAEDADERFDVVSLDATMDLEEARKSVHGRATIQGNLDPVALFAPKGTIEELVQKMLQKYAISLSLCVMMLTCVF